MMKRLIFIISVICFFSANLSAQLVDDVRNLITGTVNAVEKSDTLALKSDSDSLSLVKLQLELQEARLDAANLKLEMEAMKFQQVAGDSIKRTKQKALIDSIRHKVVGIPVEVEGDTLFYLYAKNGGYSAAQRAEMEANAIDKLGKRLQLNPDSIYLEKSETSTDLMYEGKVITTITDQDAMWNGTDRNELAQKHREVVAEKLRKMQREHSLMQWAKRLLYFLLVVIGQAILFRLTKWFHLKARAKIIKLKDTKLKPIQLQNYELLDTQKEVRILLFFANIVRWILIILQLLISVPLLFSIFPSTKNIAYKMLSYVWEPIKGIFGAILDYIPNLFTISIICIAMHYLIRLIYYLATEIEAERLKLGSFYADWAMPTYHIVRFLLYAFMVAMIYPYLPGSKSGVSQGISVFVGLIVSLGSSTVIGNIIAGMVITYMRSFKVGDRIKLNDTMGNVLEKTPLVIRVRTPKNEIVTIPNSFMMSTQTVNYSNSATEFGLIIHSEVTIGYDAPWRKVHELLVSAAQGTPGVQETPPPFVLQTSLSDYYPVYQVNAYIKDVDKMAEIYSNLHQNIQDRFNEAGIEILSPQYNAVRNGNASTIPKDDLRPKQPAENNSQGDTKK